jgi:hypothetical protein
MGILTQSFTNKLANEAVTSKKMGFYLFGGFDGSGNLTNDMFHIKPCNKENSEVYDFKRGEFYEGIEPRIYFQIKKVEFTGTPPSPRCLHVMQHVGKYLFVFGGRNASIYGKYKNSAFNDVHLFDLSMNNWETMAVYGFVSEFHFCTKQNVLINCTDSNEQMGTMINGA